MRKIIVIIVIVLLTIAIKDVIAQTKALKKGFSINLITGFPSPENYGFPGLDPDLSNKVFIGLEIGNRWYFNPQEKFGFGIMLNWFDLSFQYNEVDPPKEGSNNRTYVFNVALFELGPIGTYAIAPNLGLDAYYNIRPTYMNTGIFLDQDWEETGEGYDTADQLGFGLSHTFGAAIRLKSFALSFEYLLGNIKTVDSVLEDLDSDITGEENVKVISDHLNVNHFRIMIGFKF